jgi:hypothetical protein
MFGVLGFWGFGVLGFWGENLVKDLLDNLVGGFFVWVYLLVLLIYSVTCFLVREAVPDAVACKNYEFVILGSLIYSQVWEGTHCLIFRF